jgi:CHAD domain-containing protein
VKKKVWIEVDHLTKEWSEGIVELVEKRADEFLDELARARQRISSKTVHDLRVGSRRALAIIRMSEICLSKGNGEKKLKKEIRGVMKLMSKLRDVHIQKEYIAEMLVVFKQLTPYYQALRLREKKLLKKTGRKIEKYRMRSFRKLFDRHIEDLQKALSESETFQYKKASVNRQVDDTFAILVRRKREMRANDLESVHRFRVALKNFRYQAENMAILFPDNSVIIEEMHALQTQLGNVQDLRIIAQGLAEFAKKKRGMHLAADAITEEFERKINQMVLKLLADADKIYTFWDYSDSQTVEGASSIS